MLAYNLFYFLTFSYFYELELFYVDYILHHSPVRISDIKVTRVNSVLFYLGWQRVKTLVDLIKFFRGKKILFLFKINYGSAQENNFTIYSRRWRRKRINNVITFFGASTIACLRRSYGGKRKWTRKVSYVETFILAYQV